MFQDPSQPHTETREHKTGLVLAGGGAKGAYQIGAWRALLEKRISVNAVSGSSIGAFNAALVVSGNWAKANQLWLGLSTLRLLTVSPFFMFSLTLNCIHAIVGSVTGNATQFGVRVPAILDRRASVACSVAVILVLLFFTLAWGPPGGDWTTLAFLAFFFASPLYGAIADYLNLSIVSHKPLNNILEEIDWNAIADSEVPIHVTLSRWTNSYSHPRIARLATIPENPLESEIYGPDFVRLVRRTRWLAKARNELAAYYPVLNGQTALEAKTLVLASMAFPAGVFSQVRVGTSRYMDGGAFDNTPIYPLLLYRCDKIFVVHLTPNPKEGGLRILRPNTLRLWLYEINWLMQRIGEPCYPDDLMHGRPLPRIIHIVPKKALGLPLLGTFHFSASKSKRLMEQGYRDTLEVLAEQGTPSS